MVSRFETLVGAAVLVMLSGAVWGSADVNVRKEIGTGHPSASGYGVVISDDALVCTDEVEVDADELISIPPSCASRIGRVRFTPQDLQGEVVLPVPAVGGTVTFSALAAPGEIPVEAKLNHDSRTGLSGLIVSRGGLMTFGHLSQSLTEYVDQFAVKDSVPKIVPALSASEHTAKCQSTAWVDNVEKWPYSWNWKFNNANNPPSGAINYLIAAADSVVTGFNDCGIAAGVSGMHTYSSYPTAAVPNLNATTCFTGDGQSVVMFGSAAPYLGVTCTWDAFGSTTEADVLFDSAVPWSVAPTYSRGSSAYDLRGVATHEFGHVFGLGHPSGTSAGTKAQVMYATVGPCGYSDATLRSQDKRWLGGGDLIGLASKY